MAAIQEADGSQLNLWLVLRSPVWNTTAHAGLFRAVFACPHHAWRLPSPDPDVRLLRPACWPL